MGKQGIVIAIIAIFVIVLVAVLFLASGDPDKVLAREEEFFVANCPQGSTFTHVRDVMQERKYQVWRDSKNQNRVIARRDNVKRKFSLAKGPVTYDIIFELSFSADDKLVSHESHLKSTGL